MDLHRDRKHYAIDDFPSDELFCYILDGQEAGTFVLTTDCPETEIEARLEMYKNEQATGVDYLNFATYLVRYGYVAISGENTKKILSLY